MILKNEILSVYQQLLAGGELRHIEAKKASGGVGDSIMQTFCAFSNHQTSGANTQTSGANTQTSGANVS